MQRWAIANWKSFFIEAEEKGVGLNENPKKRIHILTGPGSGAGL